MCILGVLLCISSLDVTSGAPPDCIFPSTKNFALVTRNLPGPLPMKSECCDRGDLSPPTIPLALYEIGCSTTIGVCSARKMASYWQDSHPLVKRAFLRSNGGLRNFSLFPREQDFLQRSTFPAYVGLMASGETRNSPGGHPFFPAALNFFYSGLLFSKCGL